MTQENKDLLIKDLSARVPYGVKFVLDNGLNNVRTLIGIGEDIPYEDWQMCVYARGISAIPIEHIKPYLFPMSSMTEEQKEELKHEISKQTDVLIERMKNDDCGIDCGKYHLHSILELEWLLKNHFDFRGLIPRGLALDATNKNIY